MLGIAVTLLRYAVVSVSVPPFIAGVPLRLAIRWDEAYARSESEAGGVPERPIGAVSKTVVPFTGYRGFESHPLRQSHQTNRSPRRSGSQKTALFQKGLPPRLGTTPIR